MTDSPLNIRTNSLNEQQSSEESATPTQCPECDGKIISDEEHAETACEECGLVLDEETIDRGPEWRAFDSDERDEKSRVGSPSTELLHDKGLSTVIGWQNKDATGQAIPARKRARLQRLRTWDERYRTKDAHERNLKHGLGEINRMSSALHVPEPPRETAGTIYRRSVEEHLLPGRSIEGVASASLYAATRRQGTPRPISEIATVSRVEKIRIQRAYRYISRELGLEIEPVNPLEFVPQFASELGISDEATRTARDLLETTMNADAHSGKSPAGLAGAAIYAATHLANEQLTQETVSNVAHVGTVTIRNRYQELLDVYADEGGGT